MPPGFCSFLVCRGLSASCVTALCLRLPRVEGVGVEGTILLRVLAARLPRCLHRAGGTPSIASEIPLSLSVLPSLGNSSKYLHFIDALELSKEVALFSFLTLIFFFFFFRSLPRAQCVWFLFGGVDGRRCWSLSPSSPLSFHPLLLSSFDVALHQTDVASGVCTLVCAGSTALAPAASHVFCIVHLRCPVPRLLRL